MKKILPVLILSAAVTASPAFAQNFKPMPAEAPPASMAPAPQTLQAPMDAPAAKDMIAVYGHGNSKCSDYLEYKSKNQETVVKNYQVWMNGFMSAYNTLMAPNGNVAKGKRSDELMKWMDNYCRMNPTSYYQRATIELLRALESGEF